MLIIKVYFPKKYLRIFASILISDFPDSVCKIQFVKSLQNITLFVAFCRDFIIFAADL